MSSVLDSFVGVLVVAIATGAIIGWAEVARADGNWAGLGANDNWSTLANWGGGTLPANNGTAAILFQGSARPTPFLDMNWNVASLTFSTTASAFSLGGNSTLTIGAGGILTNSANTETINVPIVLSANQAWNTIGGGPGGALALNGAISGAGNATLTGPGTVTLAGSTANTFTGTIAVNGGTLLLGKSNGVAAISGGLVIGDGVGTDTVRLLGNFETSANVGVIINSSGVLDLNGFSTATGNVTLNGGTITAGGSPGQLILTGNVSSLANTATASIAPTLNLNGSTRTFTVARGTSFTDLSISSIISGTGSEGFVKSGPGVLVMTGASANTYTGPTTVNDGTLILNKPAGVAAVPGPLIIGDGIGTDTVRLAGNGQIASTAPVTINSSGVLDLNGSQNTVGSLTMSGGTLMSSAGGLLSAAQLFLGGDVTTNASAAAATVSTPLSLNGATRTFTVARGAAAVDLNLTGPISSTRDDGGVSGVSAQLIKAGPGILAISNSKPNTYQATTVVNGGTLLLQGAGTHFVGNTLVFGTVIPGPLVIGDGIGGANADVVLLGAGGQFSGANVPVTINSSGLLNLNGFSDTVSSLTLNGTANITNTAAGQLTLAGNLSSDGNGPASISGGTIDLGGQPATWAVAAGTAPVSLSVAAAIVDGSLVKNGNGTLALSLPGPLTIPLTLSAGTLNADGMVIGPGGSLTQTGGNFVGNLTSLGLFSHTGGAFTGRLINQSSIFFTSDFAPTNGLANLQSVAVGSGVTLTLDGAGLDNQGSLTLTAATLSGSGPLANNGLITANGANTIGGTGGFANNVELAARAGTLTLSNTGPNSNNGNIDLGAGMPLRLAGGDLANQGTINLNSGTITGPAKLVNNPGGVIAGPGAISAPLSNGGTVALTAGTLSVPSFANNGAVALGGVLANLTGGAIANAGVIRGVGQINKALTNNPGGKLSALGGGLVFSGAVANNAGGTIAVPDGAELDLMQGLGTNAGTVNLTGGTFDTNNTVLTNAGTLAGYGIFRTGGITNNAQLQLSGGTSTILGPLTNTAAGNAIVTGGATASFYSPVVNQAGSSFLVDQGSTAAFLAPVTGSAVFTGAGTKDFVAGASSLPALSTGGATSVQAQASLSVGVLNENVLSLFGKTTLTPGGGTSILGTLNILGGQLDIANDALQVRYSSGVSPLASIRGYILSGYNGGTWTGIGIVSSMADANNRGVGYADAADNVVTVLAPQNVQARLAVYGDANLDGSVSFADLLLLAHHYGQANASWDQGDFNYDGTVNFADLMLLAHHYNQALSAAQTAELTPQFLADLQAAFSQVPEPATILPTLSIAALLRRGRSRPLFVGGLLAGGAAARARGRSRMKGGRRSRGRVSFCALGKSARFPPRARGVTPRGSRQSRPRRPRRPRRGWS